MLVSFSFSQSWLLLIFLCPEREVASMESGGVLIRRIGIDGII